MSHRLPFYVGEDDPPAKREILRAALKLFSSHGLASTTIRDIAEESGYTNPALYKHFASKEELALHLFNTCHARVWTLCSEALERGATFEQKLDAFVTQWLELAEQHPDVIGFLSDSARVLWPKANAGVRRRTMIGLARALVLAARRGGAAADVDVAAASVEGTLAELVRMIQVGVAKGPASRWQGSVIALFKRSLT